MKIKVDKEARQALTAVCDVALRGAGVQSLNLVNAINKATDEKDLVEKMEVQPKDKEWLMK